MQDSTTATEALLRRDRLVVGAGIVVICLLSWSYVIMGAGTGMSMAAMTSWQFPPPMHVDGLVGRWPLSYWVLMVLMWWVMMIAMMLPSAAPTLLLYARVYRHAQTRGQIGHAVVPTAAFVAGYLVAWLAFSLVATALQWALEQAGLVHAMTMWSTSRTLSAAFLVAAGLYQLSSLKHRCLSHCRSPAEFLSHHWHPGRTGAMRMGWEHGLYCVGCCWLLMTLLFAGGIMNLVWIAGLTVFVLAEKLLPWGEWVSRGSGLLLLATGGYLLLA